MYKLRSSSIDGKDLPSPRLVSTKLAETKKITDFTKTQAIAIWGLFIGHDLAHTPASNMGTWLIRINIGTLQLTCRLSIKFLFFLLHLF